MKRAIRAKAPVIWSHWLMLIITCVLFVLVAGFVDLKPVVDENFFFSTNDPGIRQTKKIEHRFPSRHSTHSVLFSDSFPRSLVLAADRFADQINPGGKT